VPAEWIDVATAEFISVAHTGYKGFDGYGFHWWRKTFTVGTSRLTAICADGLAGQAIMIFPSIDMVVVVTGGNYDRPDREHDLVTNHLLPAAIG
jgi:CubicO group peptidase (beta-lactamase class C family)